MGDLEEKLSALMGNPQLMQQILSMASALGQEQKPEPSPPEMPKLPDLGGMQTLMRLAQGTGVDKEQQALLQALKPYLSPGRIAKLEKAMRSAKIAKLVTSLLGSGSLPL